MIGQSTAYRSIVWLTVSLSDERSDNVHRPAIGWKSNLFDFPSDQLSYPRSNRRLYRPDRRSVHLNIAIPPIAYNMRWYSLFNIGTFFSKAPVIVSSVIELILLILKPEFTRSRLDRKGPIRLWRVMIGHGMSRDTMHILAFIMQKSSASSWRNVRSRRPTQMTSSYDKAIWAIGKHYVRSWNMRRDELASCHGLHFENIKALFRWLLRVISPRSLN